MRDSLDLVQSEALMQGKARNNQMAFLGLGSCNSVVGVMNIVNSRGGGVGTPPLATGLR